MSGQTDISRELERLLQASASPYSADEAMALVRGVAAAPEGHDPNLWLDLIAPRGADRLRARLLELRSTIEAGAGAADEPDAAERLTRLRARLEQVGVDGFLLPLTDEHGSEYLPAASQRLSWLTGFTGSAGFLIAMRDRAAVFVDGRYTLQAAAELDPALYDRADITDQPPSRWLAERLRAGERVGYDPALHRPSEVERFAKAVARAGGALVPLDDNPVDRIWTGRPPQPIAPIVQLDEVYAGEGSGAKRARIGDEIGKKGADRLVITAADSIAWLLNIRGGDVPFNPLTLAYVLLHRHGGAELFVDRRKLVPGQHLGNGVSIQPIETFGDALQACGLDACSVLVDPDLVNARIALALEGAGARVIEAKDPVPPAKARKNAVEIDGARSAQVRDGAAMVRFLAWLEDAAAAGDLGERAAAARLLEERSKDPLFRGESFPAISAAGPNGAIVHYRVTEQSERRLERGGLYLIDSGGQYLDATTDVTRTVAIGTPDGGMRRHFTLVLKGHVRLARSLFPAGTTGSQLDTLAREALWQAGLDFDHGTGHGVGAYLCVHEGPARISKRGGDARLEPGMILSNEPGYYRAGAYGIRIENLVLVVQQPVPEGGERPMQGFETLTRVPIDRRLIETSLLDPDELAWVDDYHATVRTALQDHLDGDARAWLVEATHPLRSG